MKSFFKPRSWIIMAVMYALAFGLGALIFELQNERQENLNEAQAGAGQNVSGYGWSSNIGWISFNCTNDNSCATSDYGVNVDAPTGSFSGHAWSAHVGWIDFAPAPDFTNYPGCGYPGTPCEKAKYNFSDIGNDKRITGWAKILSLGNDGWIKMSDDSVSAWSGKGVKVNLATQEFSGWAWNANDNGSGIGWISFNCSNDNSCAPSNYKVIGNINIPPSAINLTAPNWNYQQAGSVSALQAILRWEFSDADAGSSQTAYRIIIDDSSDFSSPLVNTGKVAGSASQYIINTSLSYNTPYYWQVLVWDNLDAPSSWAVYNTTPDTDNDDANIPTFTTYKHEMPDPDFSWFPANPSKGEEIKFTDNSKIYLSIAPNASVACDDAKCDWLWTAPNATISDATVSTTIITFNSGGAQTVKLKITDSDGYFYEITKTISVSASLPLWRETKPK